MKLRILSLLERMKSTVGSGTASRMRMAWSGQNPVMTMSRILSRSKHLYSSNLGSEAVLKFVERHHQDHESKSEYHELCDAFKVIDLDGDGRISAAELGALLRSLGDSVPEEELLLMVGAVNGEGSRHVLLQDFIDVNTVNEGSNHAAHLKEMRAAFRLLDLNKNDFISPEEIYQVFAALGECLTMEECYHMVKSVDADGDGQINFDEFHKMMSKTSCIPVRPVS